MVRYFYSTVLTDPPGHLWRDECPKWTTLVQNIVVKKNTAESVDFSTSPFRPLADFFKELVDRSTPRSSNL